MVVRGRRPLDRREAGGPLRADSPPGGAVRWMHLGRTAGTPTGNGLLGEPGTPALATPVDEGRILDGLLRIPGCVGLRNFGRRQPPAGVLAA